jgi:hypothetical protein
MYVNEILNYTIFRQEIILASPGGTINIWLSDNCPNIRIRNTCDLLKMFPRHQQVPAATGRSRPRAGVRYACEDVGESKGRSPGVAEALAGRDYVWRQDD